MLTGAVVTIASINFDRVIEFYTQFLELTPQPYIPDVYAEFAIAAMARVTDG